MGLILRDVTYGTRYNFPQNSTKQKLMIIFYIGTGMNAFKQRKANVSLFKFQHNKILFANLLSISNNRLYTN